MSVFAEPDKKVVWAVSAGDYDPGSGFAGNGMVEKIDADKDEVVAGVRVQGAPLEMAVNRQGIAYLGNGEKGVILSFDTATLEVLDPIDVRDAGDGTGLSFVSALAVDGHDRLYATEFNHDRLFVIDTDNGNAILARFTVNDGPETLTLVH